MLIIAKSLASTFRPTIRWVLIAILSKMKRALVRDRVWYIQSETTTTDSRRLLVLLSKEDGSSLSVLSPPEVVESLPDAAPVFSRDALSPWRPWILSHNAIRLADSGTSDSFAALTSGRIQPEPYQFAPARRMLRLPRPCILIADDVGLGKTVEAGICLLELIARGRGKRILLIVPPGLISQWQEEMLEKFGLRFEALENAAALERSQTALAEGIKPWLFLDRVITSVEFLKKREVMAQAFAEPWDAIVVDEAHYLAESGTPRNPYATMRTRLGRNLRDSCWALILLTATPHNGYRHSFRSLLEMIEPTDATFEGDKTLVGRRVARTMIRRLKSQIYKTGVDGAHLPAFQPREPVRPIRVDGLSPDEVAIFRQVTSYCAKTIRAAAETDEGELVSFAMQIVKKRMLSSRAALAETLAHRLEALSARKDAEEPPTRAELRELQGDLPLAEAAQERIAERLLRSAIPKDARRKAAEKKQLQEIRRLLDRVAERPDPKIAALMTDLAANVIAHEGEKAIIFTEYRDTLAAVRAALEADPRFKGTYAELTGGLPQKKRLQRIAAFAGPGTRFLLATDAASEGLNLQRHCRRLYHFELPWNPNRMEQRNGRIDRHGQMRPPVIRYLFYPDSPEDLVLDRLVQRIAEMQADRVATPDILGIIAGGGVEENLTCIEKSEEVELTAATLLRDMDDRTKRFAEELAPLLAASDLPGGGATERDLHCADPLLDDDLTFEALVLDSLGSAVNLAALPGTYSLKSVPVELRGSGVADRYPSFTMRRSVAVTHPASDVEFVTRLHPLYLAILDRARRHLTAAHSPTTPSRRLAVRRHDIAEQPYALFTFGGEGNVSDRNFMAVALDPAGNYLEADKALAFLDPSDAPGEVSWTDIEKFFALPFAALQQKAAAAALETQVSRREVQLAERKKTAATLRADAERYRGDRLAEIDREEKEAKTSLEGRQATLFEEREVTGFKARRAAVETHHRRRLKELDSFLELPDPQPPQPLGVLFVFPT